MANLQATTFSGGIFQKVGTSTVSGTTLTVDLATGSYFEADFQSLSGDVTTFTISNTPATSGQATIFTIKITQGSTARQFTWRNQNLKKFKWVSSAYWGIISGPTITTTVDDEDILSFTTYDNGETWYSELIGEKHQRVAISGDRGLFCGGDYGDSGNYGGNVEKPMNALTIDYITISTTGNATDFGDLSVGRGYTSALSNGTRGVIAGGRDYGPPHVMLNTIDYITIATPSATASDFGDLVSGRARKSATAVSGGGRGVICGGLDDVSSPWVEFNQMDYITISTTSDALNFGNMALGGWRRASCSNGIRGVLAGGYFSPGGNAAAMEFFNIATPSHCFTFGELTGLRTGAAGTSDGSRGVIGLGHNTQNDLNGVDYITIDTVSNATNFGNLTRANKLVSACSNGSRGVWGGGWSVPVPSGLWATNAIDYITIATTGSGTNFGDLTSPRDTLSACSGN